jgi:hypothetical protein
MASLHGQSLAGWTRKNFKDTRDGVAFEKYWPPSECQALISFEPDLPVISTEPSPQPPLPSRLQDLLNASEHAEAEPGLRFVGLKWFRDQHLPRQELSWAADPRERSAQLREATDQGIVMTVQVPNPKAPSIRPRRFISTGLVHVFGKKLTRQQAARDRSVQEK